MSVLRRLLAQERPPWGRLALAAALGVAAALATLGLLAGSGYVVDRAAARPGLGAIAGLLAIVEVMAFMRAPLRYAERLVAHDAALRSLGRWRVWLYDRLEPRAPAAWRSWRSGDLLVRAVEDVDTVQDLFVRVLIPVVVGVVAPVLAVVVVGLILPAAALVLAVALLVGLTVPPALARRASPRHGEAARLHGAMGAEVVDLVQGAADLVAFGHEEDLLDRVARTDTQLNTLARRQALASGLGAAVLVLCTGGAVVGVLMAGIAALSGVVGHRLDPVWLAALPLAAVAAFESVPPVAAAAAHSADVVEAGRRLLALDEVPVPVADPPHPERLPASTLGGAGAVPVLHLDRARLRYGPDLPWVLDGLSLSVPPGSRVAVLGPSGSGKTSIVNVLLRFWPLSGGTAALGGVALERLAQRDVRRTLALVDQEARLFAGSIRANVVLGRPEAGPADVSEALRQAQLTDWVATLPAGLDTPVGESGAQVSGGQRRRLALARALVAGGPVLVLDEPTAGLDEATAERLMADVLAAAGDRTVVLVTHRRREADGFDQVIELTR